MMIVNFINERCISCVQPQPFFTFTYPIVMDCRGAIRVLATNSLHSSRLSAFLKVSLSSNPVHSLILSSHLFCLPFFLPTRTVPCNMVLASPDDLVTCPYHFSFQCLIAVRRSSCNIQADKPSLLLVYNSMEKLLIYMENYFVNAEV